MAFLDKNQPVYNAEIITLALHVNYWDGLGWKDPYSTELYTQRQRIYGERFRLDSIYTPEMVVDGSYEFTGSDLGKAQKVIAEAAKRPKAKIEIAGGENSLLKISISEVPKHEQSSVYLAVAEDNLSNHVFRGENAGNQLEHMSVVRELTPLGMIKVEENSFAIDVPMPTNPEWKCESLKIVVFVQENSSRKILGVQKYIGG